jgi:hypothetical protein
MSSYPALLVSLVRVTFYPWLIVIIFIYLAVKAYEDHVRKTGEQVSHPMMKEMLAGIAAAEVDKLFETKGLDFLDREEAKRRAVHQAHQLADEKYGSGATFNGQGNQQQWSESVVEEHHHHHQHHHRSEE